MINDDIIIPNNDNGNDVSSGSQTEVRSLKYHLIHHCIGGVQH